jgi:hypothetical protein
MLVKQLLKIASDPELPLRPNNVDQVDTADKTKLYLQLDNLMDFLQVYRDDLKGTRVPFYHAKYLQKK